MGVVCNKDGAVVVGDHQAVAQRDPVIAVDDTNISRAVVKSRESTDQGAAGGEMMASTSGGKALGTANKRDNIPIAIGGEDSRATSDGEDVITASNSDDDTDVTSPGHNLTSNNGQDLPESSVSQDLPVNGTRKDLSTNSTGQELEVTQASQDLATADTNLNLTVTNTSQELEARNIRQDLAENNTNQSLSTTNTSEDLTANSANHNNTSVVTAKVMDDYWGDVESDSDSEDEEYERQKREDEEEEVVWLTKVEDREVYLRVMAPLHLCLVLRSASPLQEQHIKLAVNHLCSRWPWMRLRLKQRDQGKQRTPWLCTLPRHPFHVQVADEDDSKWTIMENVQGRHKCLRGGPLCTVSFLRDSCDRARNSATISASDVTTDSTSATSNLRTTSPAGDAADHTSTIGGNVNPASTIVGNVDDRSASDGSVDLTSTSCGSLDPTSTSGGNVDPASTLGGCVEYASTSGDSLDPSSISGGNVNTSSKSDVSVDISSITGDSVDLLSTGGSVEPSSTTSGSLESTSTSSGSRDHSSNNGECVDPSSTTGGGVDPSPITVGRVDPSSTTVGNVDPSSTTGSRVDPSSTTVDGVDPPSAAGGSVDPSSITGSRMDATSTTGGSNNNKAFRHKCQLMLGIPKPFVDKATKVVICDTFVKLLDDVLAERIVDECMLDSVEHPQQSDSRVGTDSQANEFDEQIQLIQNLRSYCGVSSNNNDILTGGYNGEENEVEENGYIKRTIEPSTSRDFINKCKAERVTYISGFTTCVSAAIMNFLVKAGADPESGMIEVKHKVYVHYRWPEAPYEWQDNEGDDDSDSEVTSERPVITITASPKDWNTKFWTTVNSVNKKQLEMPRGRRLVPLKIPYNLENGEDREIDYRPARYPDVSICISDVSVRDSTEFCRCGDYLEATSIHTLSPIRHFLVTLNINLQVHEDLQNLHFYLNHSTLFVPAATGRRFADEIESVLKSSVKYR